MSPLAFCTPRECTEVARRFLFCLFVWAVFLVIMAWWAETTRNEGSTKKGLPLVIDEHPLFLLMMDRFEAESRRRLMMAGWIA